MDLIVTHDNADFDALSSLIAASKLYPGSRLLLPGSQERAVRDFLALIKDKFRIETEKTCLLENIDRVIVVDNNRLSRLGKISEFLRRENITVHVYDHHPRNSSNIKADEFFHEELGATVTLILQELSKKGKFKDLTPLEATLMLLGIYQETGSLSYAGTTKNDVNMVSKLLDRGAKLGAVNSYLNRELSESEFGTFLKMLGNMEIERIDDLEIAFFSCCDKDFHGEAGSVVHKLREVENFPVIFALFYNDKRVKIIARSRVGYIKVNEILGAFGGGGHRSAASARTLSHSPETVRSEIIENIFKIVKPVIPAYSIMSSPVKTLNEDMKVTEAYDILRDWGFKGAPVRDDKGNIKAMITQGDLKKALVREMGHSRIKGYMTRPLLSVGPEAPLSKLKEIIIEKNKGRIPVFDHSGLVGIVTRTDILKKIHHSLFTESEVPFPKEKILSKMKSTFSKDLFEFAQKIGERADRFSIRAFLVGGVVRDLMLDIKNLDLDIVVDRDAIEFARYLADTFGGSLVVHNKFGTATVVEPCPQVFGKTKDLQNKFKIDIATARKETYKKPAALPSVKFSSLKNDLYRRDFTINAMAINLNKDNFGSFVDFFGGLEDLESRSIRVLHDNSFIDDPTRIFRAVRFEQRFDFKIEKYTEFLIKHALVEEMFGRTENQRIRDELILMLTEPSALKAVKRMRNLNELRFIHRDLVLPSDLNDRFSKLHKVVQWYSRSASGKRKLDLWLIRFMIVIDELDSSQAREVVSNFVFEKSVSIRIKRYKEHSARVLNELSSGNDILPSRVWEILTVFSHESILSMHTKTCSEIAEKRIELFLEKYNTVKLCIKGEDIKKEGVGPGPVYGEILAEVLKEKLNGKLGTRQEELWFMKKILSDK